jgi:hypothetical protein
MECMTKVENQQKLNAKDDQLFSESFENSTVDQSATHHEQPVNKMDLILLKLGQLSHQHEMDRVKSRASTDLQFREERKASISRENARQQELMEFVQVSTNTQVKLSIDQVSAEYAMTGSMLERKLRQMQASVELIASSTAERFQQLEMHIDKSQQAQVNKPLICCLEECQKTVEEGECPKYGGPMRACTWQHHQLHKARINSGAKKMRKVEEIEQQYDQAWQFEEECKSERMMHEGDEKILPGAGWDEAVYEVENGAGWSEVNEEAPSKFQFKLESVSVARQPLKAPSKGETLEELQLQAALIESKRTAMVNSVQRGNGAQSMKHGGKDEKKEQSKISAAEADEAMNLPPFNQSVYDYYKQQLSQGKLLKRCVRSGKNYLRNVDQQFTGQLTNMVHDRMFMFDDMVMAELLEYSVRVLVDGVEERIQYTSDMLLDDLARHIFVMSDDKAKVEDACRPVYKWEHDAMRTNLSGASQQLEANQHLR